MDQILLCTNHIPRTTLIHNSFIENYMMEANGDYVKVYLYLAKCIQYQESELSISSLADHMDNTEKDVIRALQYWEKRNLLLIKRDPHTGYIIGIEMLLPEHSPKYAESKHVSTISASTGKGATTDYAHTSTDTLVSGPIAPMKDATADYTHIPTAALNSGQISPTESMAVDYTQIPASHDARQINPMESMAADYTPIPTVALGSGQISPTENAGVEPAAQIPEFPSKGTMHLETAATSYISTPMGDNTRAFANTQVKTKTNPIDETGKVSVSNATLEELANNEEFIWTCHVIESYLDRPMKPNETRLISYLYGTLHFSKDLLLYLYEYCISLGKTNPNYIQAVALSWDEQGVTTPEEAEKVSTAYNSAYNAVSKSLALGRALATVEKKCVDRWQHSWHMDLSVILEACNRTILKVHKADFKYIEGILDRWQQNGVHTLQDVEKADLAYVQNKKDLPQNTDSQLRNRPKNQFQNFQQRNTSAQEVDDLERRLLMR